MCGCRQKLVSQEQKTALFDGLDPTRKYFPLVAENGFNTFYGIAPNPIHPSERDEKVESNEGDVDDASDDYPGEQDALVLEDEENEWEAWQKEVFPSLFHQCIPPYRSTHVSLSSSHHLPIIYSQDRKPTLISWRHFTATG